MDDQRRADVEAWLMKADEDLEVARIVRAARGPAAAACFHCQQAAEKALKAALAAAGAVPPKTHDLIALASDLRAHGADPGLDDEQLLALRAYAVEPRYPGFGAARAADDLPVLVSHAEAIVAMVRRSLEPGR